MWTIPLVYIHAFSFLPAIKSMDIVMYINGKRQENQFLIL
jgi:hypothetical protein